MVIPLGKISVPVPGTPVQVTASAQYLAMTQVGGAMDPRFLTVQAVLFQTWAGNSGIVYIGGAGMVKGTGAKVMNALGIPTTSSMPSFGASNHLSPAGIDLSTFWVDADVANEGPLVTLLVT